MRIFSNADRPVHLSPFPVERLRRASVSDETLRATMDPKPQSSAATTNVLANICREYCGIYERFRDGVVASEKAPYFEEPSVRSDELKSMALFFDATLVGVCNIPELAWLGKGIPGHTNALVVAVEYNDHIEDDNPVRDLIRQSDGAVAKLRATEVATVVSGYIRQLGFSAVAHTPHRSDISLNAMAVKSGIARVRGGRNHSTVSGVSLRHRCCNNEYGAGTGYATRAATVAGGRRRLVVGCGRNGNLVEPMASTAPTPRMG